MNTRVPKDPPRACIQDSREVYPITNRPAQTSEAARTYEQHHREQYQHEQERLAEWIDLGGEGGA